MSIPPSSSSSPSPPYVTPTPTVAPAAALGPSGAVLSWPPPPSPPQPLQATIIPIHLVGGSSSAAAVAAAQLKNCDNREQTNEGTGAGGQTDGSAENELRRVTSHIRPSGDKPEVVSKAEGKEAETQTTHTLRWSGRRRRRGERTVIQTHAKDRRLHEE